MGMEAELERLKRLVFQLLLTTENRTTDFLELITGETMIPSVLKQSTATQAPLLAVKEGTRDAVLRESLLRTEKSGLVVSQNIAVMYPDFIPLPINLKLAQKKEGIGKIMRDLNIRNTRTILDFGWRKPEHTTDLTGNPYSVTFADNPAVPYKQYTITFEEFNTPGLHLLEYFNPRMLEGKEIAAGQEVYNARVN
ncbi:hypothetical protein [Paenibacillus sp. HGH0039]|nr:hypothetical protein [Paenibacillus sp. HGH0039]EGL16003.1 hypothetical protein HMPREF9413_0002 [Paenibacillus sp. HGF7]EPD80957.1 hypothetical protein HMPREF1207_04714 [Paenibacillus sp. HGH0039]